MLGNRRGPGYLKLNQNLLNDKGFVCKTKTFIKDFFVHNTGTAKPTSVWEAFKCSFRGHAVAYSSWKKNLFPQMYGKKIKQYAECEGLITEEELFLAVMSFKAGKTPGMDGIPIEIYQKFFDLIKGPLLSCYNFSCGAGHLPDSQKEGLISLLLKQEPSGQYKDQ